MFLIQSSGSVSYFLQFGDFIIVFAIIFVLLNYLLLYIFHLTITDWATRKHSCCNICKDSALEENNQKKMKNIKLSSLHSNSNHLLQWHSDYVAFLIKTLWLTIITQSKINGTFNILTSLFKLVPRGFNKICILCKKIQNINTLRNEYNSSMPCRKEVNILHIITLKEF